MTKIAVLGAGIMGVGVAQNLVATQHQVILVDIKPEALAEARSRIREGLRFHAMMTGQKLPAPAGELLERIEFTTDYQRVADSPFVIENTPEKWEVKQEVYGILESVARREAVLAANTSAVSIDRIASLTTRPDRVVGIHFMNPVPMKPMVEVIRGSRTSEETLRQTAVLLEQMNKEMVVVRDSPGFVSNRVLMLTVNEAIHLVHEGVSSAEDVDRIFRGCFEHKMGPLETADLIGLDTILDSLVVLRDQMEDQKFEPCPLLCAMVTQGQLGRKSGSGFYEYASGSGA